MDGAFWYVYMLQGLEHPEHYYVGMTEDLPERLRAHNAGKVHHTSKSAPWRIETAVAFRDKTKAAADRVTRSRAKDGCYTLPIGDSADVFRWTIDPNPF